MMAAAHTGPSFLARILRPFTTGTSRFNPDSPTQPTFSPNGSATAPQGGQLCTIAAGCFWGPEHMYRHHFTNKGLLDARVGYTGGIGTGADTPTYRNVCSGRTGHAEACQIRFDPEKVSYKQLLEFFFRMHDPTTHNRQGPDMGSQYRSAIWYHDDEQEHVAKEVTRKVKEQWFAGKGTVVTEVLPASAWYDAEGYHQQYLDDNPGGYECPTHFLRNFPELS